MRRDEIKKRFGGKLVGTKKLKQYVCETVTFLPEDLQTFISAYCWFVGSMDDAWGYAFTGDDLEDQHLIFLSDDLFRQSDEQIQWSILHEIGHVVLGHKNNIFFKQDKKAIHLQEEEADHFASLFA